MSPCIHGKKIVDQNTKQTEGSFTSVRMVHTHTFLTHNSLSHNTKLLTQTNSLTHNSSTTHNLSTTSSNRLRHSLLHKTWSHTRPTERHRPADVALSDKDCAGRPHFCQCGVSSDSRRCYSQEHRSKRETQTINGRRTIFLRICLRV